MNKVRFACLVGVLILLMGLVPAALAAPPPGNWVSGIACQNLSTTESANVTISFYKEGSSTPSLNYVDPQAVAPGGTRNYYTPSSPPGLEAGFLGSAVVSSNTQMACNVNTQTTGTGTASSPFRIGTSAGFDSTAVNAKMYAPQVMKRLAGTWSSYMAVQNTTGASVAVTVSYSDRNGAAVAAATETATIAANSSKVFYQEDNAGLPDNFVGGAVVSADNGTSGLAMTVNFYNNAASTSSAQLHSYNGFGASGAAGTLVVPRVVRSFYGYNSGISVQNVGGAATSVSIVFNFAGQTFNYSSPSIAPNASLVLYLPSMPELNGVDALPVPNRFGSAVITAASGGSIVAIVNEDNRGGSGIPAERAGQGTTYNAVPSTAATPTILFPQVVRKASVFSGGFQISNTTGSAGTCNITYNADADAAQNGVALPASGSISIYAPNVPNLADGYNNSVSVTCTQAVVGISNLAAEPGSGGLGDSFTQGNGLNR